LSTPRKAIAASLISRALPGLAMLLKMPWPHRDAIVAMEPVYGRILSQKAALA
jgi:hypothetical protein